MRKSARTLAVLCLALLIMSGASPVDSAPAYVGNVKSKVFHLLSCKYAGCKNCTKHFESRTEAIDAGYRPGGCCHP